MSVAREHWGSRLGFIMASAGSAVGLGNVWKFPYMAGENGGGAFLIIYLGCVVFFGLSLVIAELLIGRMAQSNPVGAFRTLGGRGWPAVGAMGVVTAFIILSFYIVVAGWTLAYILFMGENTFGGVDIEQSTKIFTSFIASPVQPLVYAAIFTVLMVGVVLGGVASGIERASKWLMPLLFVLLVVLAIRAVTLPGAGEGVDFYLMPDWSRVTASTWGGAISQAFFSLSLGMGAMLTYASYLDKQVNLPKTAAQVTVLDTTFAVIAGFMVLPAVFAFGFDPPAFASGGGASSRSDSLSWSPSMAISPLVDSISVYGSSVTSLMQASISGGNEGWQDHQRPGHGDRGEHYIAGVAGTLE
mgnify:CR=1 FL=1